MNKEIKNQMIIINDYCKEQYRNQYNNFSNSSDNKGKNDLHLTGMINALNILLIKYREDIGELHQIYDKIYVRILNFFKLDYSLQQLYEFINIYLSSLINDLGEIYEYQ